MPSLILSISQEQKCYQYHKNRDIAVLKMLHFIWLEDKNTNWILLRATLHYGGWEGGGCGCVLIILAIS